MLLQPKTMRLPRRLQARLRRPEDVLDDSLHVQRRVDEADEVLASLVLGVDRQAAPIDRDHVEECWLIGGVVKEDQLARGGRL